MISVLRSSVRPAQAAISSRVRPQPAQSAWHAAITQRLTHGEETLGFAFSSDIGTSLRISPRYDRFPGGPGAIPGAPSTGSADARR
jgi:hypothetical protein